MYSIGIISIAVIMSSLLVSGDTCTQNIPSGCENDLYWAAKWAKKGKMGYKANTMKDFEKITGTSVSQATQDDIAQYWVCTMQTPIKGVPSYVLMPKNCNKDGDVLGLPCGRTCPAASSMIFDIDWYSWYQIHYYDLMVFVGFLLVILCGLNVYAISTKGRRKQVRYAAVKRVYDSDTEYEVQVKPLKN